MAQVLDLKLVRVLHLVAARQAVAVVLRAHGHDLLHAVVALEVAEVRDGLVSGQVEVEVVPGEAAALDVGDLELALVEAGRLGVALEEGEAAGGLVGEEAAPDLSSIGL